MELFLVWRDNLLDESTLIAICSTLEKAKLFVDMPNFDLYITKETLDSDEIKYEVVYGA